MPADGRWDLTRSLKGEILEIVVEFRKPAKTEEACLVHEGEIFI